MIEHINWSKIAERSYGQILEYIAGEFGKTRAKKFAIKVFVDVSKLPANPGLGQKEPLLEGARYEFRRLVIDNLTKVIYRITDDSIEIADVWDARKDPKDLVQHLID